MDKAPPSPAETDGGEIEEGYSFESGQRFHAPKTHNTVRLLCRVWQPGSFVTVLMMAMLTWFGMPAMALMKLSIPLPEWVQWSKAHGAGSLTERELLGIAIFWRLMYNVFLGAILRLQSDTKFLTKWIAKVQARDGSLMRFAQMLSASLPGLAWVAGSGRRAQDRSVLPSWRSNLQRVAVSWCA